MVRHCADDGDSGAPAARALAASTACGRETADYIYHIFPTIRLHKEPSIIFSKRRARTEARQGRSDFLCARPRTRDIFAAEPRLTRQKERDHARAMNELAGLETFVSFSFIVFVSSCLCTKLK